MNLILQQELKTTSSSAKKASSAFAIWAAQMKSASSEIVASVPTTYDGGTHQQGPGILQHDINSSVLQKFHSRKLETEAAHIYSHQQVLIKPGKKKKDWVDTEIKISDP